MIITTAMLTPFMVATAPETPAQTQEPAAIYNWQEQGAADILNEEDMKNAAMGSFSSGGIGQPRVVDDWYMC